MEAAAEVEGNLHQNIPDNHRQVLEAAGKGSLRVVPRGGLPVEDIPSHNLIKQERSTKCGEKMKHEARIDKEV